METTIWRRCGSCKEPIFLGSNYYACTVSSCKKTAYCSMDCFSMHIPVMRHKDAWAEEKTAPKVLETATEELDQRRRVVSPTQSAGPVPQDVLVVASKLKQYIQVKSGMNTSATVMTRLSEMIRLHCDRAIERARADGRKTVLDRDFLA